MPGNLSTALVYVINALTSLYLIVFLLRLIMPWCGVDYRNPVAQGVMRLSSPLVTPLRRFVPAIGQFDTATALVALIIQSIAIVLMLLVMGIVGDPIKVLATAAVKLVVLTIMLFVYAIIIRIVISWISPGTYNPIIGLVNALTEPVLRPFQRLIPPLGGFDLSPIFATIGLMALSIIVRGMQYYGL